ncbi:MaoC family dehydratase [Tistrella mobilis]|jgi:3-hydroxybutyryl-CoA dehydratase|uniref:MaoC family dehydratase n=1 Tax=Tistrella mobilis TaxID=171437 RepID=UPI003558E4A6
MTAISGLSLEDMTVGMESTITHTVTDADVRAFADISGDHNPVHLDEDFAQTTPFKGRIAHGAFTTSLISAVLGTRLPGPGAILVDQSFRYRAPVRIGDTVTALVRVNEIDPARRRVTLATECLVGDTVVVDGITKVMVPARAAALAAAG